MTAIGRFEIKGVESLIRRFDELGVGIVQPMREASTLASKIIAQAARENIKDRPADGRKRRTDPTGTLRRSIGFRVVTYKRNPTVVGIIGTRRGVKGYARATRFATRTVRRPRARTTEDIILRAIEGRRQKGKTLRVASRYAHLVEKGTRRSAARPFLRPALDRARGAVSVAIRSTLRSWLEREAVRLGRGDILR